ncbi:hypothetical protein ACFVAJ_16730 [Agromyces sp. NPDC057679]|uniref:hypothetical protein n=1 Tax=Agromyces sp. NPDC057679 TaxID=3346207 RepID=UPI00366F239F
MQLIGSIRPKKTTSIKASGHDRGSAYQALAAEVPPGSELIQAHFSMKAGVTGSTGKHRAVGATPIEASGTSYDEAIASLHALVPEGYVLLSVKIAA